MIWKEFDVTSHADDIRIPDGDATDAASAADAKLPLPAPHEVSLRAYLEVIYYADATTKPPMAITLRGVRVPPRDWSEFLKHWPRSREAYEVFSRPRDRGEEEPAAAASRIEQLAANSLPKKTYGASVRFGFREDLEEIISVLEKRKAPEQAKLAARKSEIEAYTGVFYYNHHRLIMALQRLPKQNSGHTGGSLNTVKIKITKQGIATGTPPPLEPETLRVVAAFAVACAAL